MKDMLEYNVTLLKLQDLKTTLEGAWSESRLVVSYCIDHSAPAGFGFMPRNLDSQYSIRKICLIEVLLFLDNDPQPHLPKCKLKLFYGGGHLLDNQAPVGGYSTDQALAALLDKMIALAPDRNSDNKIGEALAALR